MALGGCQGGRAQDGALLNAVAALRDAGVTGVGVTGAYHARGVAPLQRRSISLDQMIEGFDPRGTVLLGGPPTNEEVAARLDESFEDPVPVYPIEGHPPMHPNFGAPRVVSAFSLRFFLRVSSSVS